MNKKKGNWTKEDIAHLRGVATQIKDGQAAPDDIFPVVAVASETNDEGSKKEEKASSSNPPKTESPKEEKKAKPEGKKKDSPKPPPLVVHCPNQDGKETDSEACDTCKDRNGCPELA
jgi:hypothetical protein